MDLKINNDQLKAIADLKAKIDSNPKDAKSYWQLGSKYDAVHDRAKALSCYYRAITILKPSLREPAVSAENYNLMGLCLSDVYLPHQAIRYYRKAISLDSKNPVYYFNLSLAEDAAGDRQASIKQMEAAIGLDPHDADNYNQLGLLNFDANRYAEAAHDEQTAIILNQKYGDQNEPAYYYDLACIQDKQGHYFDGLESIKTAIGMLPDGTAVPKNYDRTLRDIKRDLDNDSRNDGGDLDGEGPEGESGDNELSYDPDVDYTRKLDDLIGLKPVKSMLKTIVNQVEMNEIRTGVRRHKRMHMIFEGDPGTGKTTVANLLCRILYQKHIIPKQRFISVNATQLVFSHYGQSARKVRELVDQSVGGVLFIDEAYYLAHRSDGNSACQDEAMNAFLTAIDKHDDDVVVIMAGYTHKMEHMLRKCNQGLRSRFPKQDRILFPDYSSDECVRILRYFMQKGGFKVADAGTDQLLSRCMGKYAKTALNDTQNTFANARTVENVYDRLVGNQADRLLGNYSFDQLIKFKRAGDPIISEFTNADVKRTFKHCAFRDEKSATEGLDALIGLKNVKRLIKGYLHLARVTKVRHDDFNPDGMDLIFEGNPGTGKTTVAKLFCKLLYQRGLVKSNNYEFLSASMLESSVVGRSAENLRRAFYKAKGGVLFIDEAYALMNAKKKGSNLLPELVDDLSRYNHSEVVILAGYPKAMENLMRYGNAGLSSRFAYRITFKDYTDAECLRILKYDLEHDGLKLANGKTKGLLKRGFTKFIQQAKANRRYRFANARTVNVFFKYLKQSFADRLCHKSSGTWLKALKILGDKRLNTVTYQDVERTLKRCSQLKIYRDADQGAIGFR